MDEKLVARAKLIFERDSNSPLFLITADFYLQHGNPQTAISILENGLPNYPEHPLAFILMGKAQHALGNISASEEFFKKASELLNSPSTFEYYRKEFKLPDKHISPFDYSRGNIFMNSSDDFIFEEESKPSQPQPIDDNLQHIADMLINTRIDQNSDINTNDISKNEFQADKSLLASETFANIYLSQGQKNEAIKVYELLANRYPDKKEYYFEKIRKIKSQ